ncbi:hypothetical protein [Mucilaginibacter sp. UYCu711]|uniref:hypothetical protein n=1 Tax=Mucilaginibacter sp. UYCu711 TaxID=3156339 RepID=UPI003D25CDF9
MNANKLKEPGVPNYFKLFTIILINIFVFNTAIAQNKVEKFCRLTVIWKSEHRQLISINYGDKKDLLDSNNPSIINKLDSINNFTNDINAINYMSKLGWSFKKIVSISQFTYVCYFRKIYELTN